VVADSVEETILDLNAAKRDSLLQQRAGGGGGDDDAAADAAAAAAAAPAMHHHSSGSHGELQDEDEDEDEAAARRWDVEGIERGVLSSLTDSLLSPRCSRSPEPPLETAAEPESEDL
jgi:hypothetical protein